MQDFVLTILAFGSHTDRNDVFTGLGFMEWKKKQFKKRNIGLENTKMQPVRQKRCQKIKKIYIIICLNLKIVCGKGQSEQGNYSTDHQHCGPLRSAKYPVPWAYLE